MTFADRSRSMWKSSTQLAFGKHLPAGPHTDPSAELLSSNAKLQHRLEGLQVLLKQAQCTLQEDVSLAQSAHTQQVAQFSRDSECRAVVDNIAMPSSGLTNLQELASLSQSDTKVKRKQRISDGLKSALVQLSALQSELLALHQNAQAWSKQAESMQRSVTDCNPARASVSTVCILELLS